MRCCLSLQATRLHFYTLMGTLEVLEAVGTFLVIKQPNTARISTLDLRTSQVPCLCLSDTNDQHAPSMVSVLCRIVSTQDAACILLGSPKQNTNLCPCWCSVCHATA